MMAMDIDLNQPVWLTQITPHNGNIYHPRKYNPGELPTELMVAGIVSQQSTPTQKTFRDGAFEDVKITIGSAEPSSTPTNFSAPQLQSAPVRIQINVATADMVSKLPGVGIKTALKVVQEAAKEKFSNIEDLTARVPLTGSATWNAIQSQILFD